MTALAGYFADPVQLAERAQAMVGAGQVDDVTSATDYAGGRRVLFAAFSKVIGRAPSAVELQAIEAIALHETGLGQIGQFAGSHNWGAVQCPGTWGADACPADCTMGKDSAPGTGVKPVCFRSYPDDVAGAVDLVRNLTIARPRTFRSLQTGDADQVAGAMYAERYYTGTSHDPAANVGAYAGGIARRAAQVARGLHEPLRVRRYLMGPPSATGPVALGAAFAALALRQHLMAIAGEDPEKALTVTGDLGSWLPTFVTPDDARRYVREADAQFDRVAQDVERMGDKLAPELKQSWAVDLEAWRKFRDDSIASVSIWNTRATMEQTDRWVSKLIEWRKTFAQANVPITGPGPVAPGQGLGDRDAGMMGAGWVHFALFVAALFGVGYLVRGFRP